MLSAAAVVTAGMAFTVVVSVVVALDIRIKQQSSRDEFVYSNICRTAYAAVKLDGSCRQSSLSTCAYAAADKNISLKCSKNTGKRAVSAAVGVNNFRGNYLSVLNIVNLKLLGVSKMLEYHAIFISYRNSHIIISLRFLMFLMIEPLKAALVFTA